VIVFIEENAFLQPAIPVKSTFERKMVKYRYSLKERTQTSNTKMKQPILTNV